MTPPTFDPAIFAITHAELLSTWVANDRNQGGFEVHWQTKGAGFGRTVVWLDGDGQLTCDNECMSREFIASVFAHLVGTMRLKDEV